MQYLRELELVNNISTFNPFMPSAPSHIYEWLVFKKSIIIQM